jgi:hypothetical protein
MHRLVPLFLSLALLFASSLFAQQPQLSLSIDAGDRLSPAGLGDVRFQVENTSDQDATNVLLDMFLGNGAKAAAFAQSDPATVCAQQNIGQDRVGCRIPLLAAHAKSGVTITAHFEPGHYGFRFFVNPKTVTSTTTFYREYPVTTPADGGPGSFRQAILDTNAECAAIPCRIDFEISEPIPAAGWFTIALASPLPRVLAPEIAIDGERQTAITGDTNPRGPEIFLDGRGVHFADGLIVSGNNATIRGLAIGGFPANGLLVLHSVMLIEHNDIGTDPTGTVPVPNGLRGIMGDGFGAEIRENVLSHNIRSGIFLWHNANIHDNRIESNGASGIFLGGETVFDNSIVAGNVITGNHDFGIAAPRRNVVEVRANTIAHNDGGGIDIGLDGRTPETNDFLLGPVSAPHIDSARFDAATGDTIIEGPIPFAFHQQTLYLYANTTLDPDGFAEGERFLGTPQFAAGRFTLRVHEDLRGLLIDGNTIVTANNDVIARGTSEFGRAVRVE